MFSACSICELRSPSDDRDVGVALQGDRVLGNDLGRGNPGISFLERRLRVDDLLRPLADNRPGIFSGLDETLRLPAVCLGSSSHPADASTHPARISQYRPLMVPVGFPP